MARRIALLAGLLLVEYFVVSSRFDAQPMLQRTGALAALGYLGTLAPLIVVVAAAILIHAGGKLRDAITAITAQLPPARLSGLFIALNLSSFVALYLLTRAIFHGPKGQADDHWLWLLAWGLSAVATVLTLLPAALPLRALPGLLRGTLGVLSVGAGAGLLAWLSGMASLALWPLLQGLTLQTVGAMLRPIVPNLVVAPADALVGNDRFWVEVAPICSGFEGIGLMTVLLSLYMLSVRKSLRFPRALLLFPLALSAVWLLNAFRIAALICIGIWISPAIALGGFHSKAGWILFSGLALAVVAWSRRSGLFAREVLDDGPHENPTAPYLMPLLALLATGLITGVFSLGFDVFYGLRIAAVLSVLWIYRKPLASHAWAWSWEAPLLGATAFVLWLWLAQAPAPEQLDQLQQGLSSMTGMGAGLWLTLKVVGSVLTVPIAEELTFRGFVLRRLMSKEFDRLDPRKLTALSLVVSSLAFGALHQEMWLAATGAGVLYGLAQARHGRVSDAIIAHAVTNALVAAAALWGDALWLWA